MNEMNETIFPMAPEQLQRHLLDGSIIIALNETHSMLQRIEGQLRRHHESELVPDREWFTPAEIALELGKAEFTVREWCRNGRVQAFKIGERGGVGEWRIHRDEIARYRNEGLLPTSRSARGRLG